MSHASHEEFCAEVLREVRVCRANHHGSLLYDTALSRLFDLYRVAHGKHAAGHYDLSGKWRSELDTLWTWVNSLNLVK